MTTYTPQAKGAASFTKTGIDRTTGGEVFFGWMFLFTQSTGSSPFSKVAKAATSFTSVVKP